MATKIRWLVAHDPIHLFLRTANAFSQKISDLTSGKYEVEILTVSDYKEKYNPDIKNVGGHHIVNFLCDNDIEMSQTRTHSFARLNTDFLSFDMPFLFENHDHATKVFEGPIGQKALDSLSTQGEVQGLAFTYSGGFRVIGSNEPIIHVDQLKGKPVRVNTNPVNWDYMEAIGAQPVRLTSIESENGFDANYGWDEIENGSIQATETTYLRFKGKYILKSEHNMFLTTIAISGKFWQSLDIETQGLFKQAALETSRLERQWSLEDADNFEKNCSANGVKIFEIDEADIRFMKNSITSVYEKWTPKFSSGLIDQITKLRNT